MIPRYTPNDFAELWSQASKYRAWLEVELAACRAMENHGWVPAGTAASLEHVGPKLDPAAIDAIEAETRHDVIAFLTHVEALGGAPARFLHRGMTSSDVLDTSTALLLVRAHDALMQRLDAVVEALAKKTDAHRHDACIGRSHGIHAEPLTFGMVLAGHLAEFVRARKQLRDAREVIAVGKLAGAVGSYAHLSPAFEQEALASLGLKPETVSTQVVARDRHAVFINACAVAAAAIERLATNVRHWQRTEVGEAEEAFSKGQKGSSAMPHKRNPILSENLCGLARVVRAYVVPALENVSLWHERDISHSSVERMMLPDVTATLAFALGRTRGLVEGLVVRPEALKQNLERTGGLWASEALLLSLVDAGVPRQEGYVWIQRNAMAAFEGRGDFLDLVLADEAIRGKVDEAKIRYAFSLEHALAHVQPVIDRALAEARQ